MTTIKSEKSELDFPKQEEMSILTYYRKVLEFCFYCSSTNELVIKGVFIRGLTPDNQIKASKFGPQLSLNVLVQELIKTTKESELQSILMGELTQEKTPIRAYYEKIVKICKDLDYSKKDTKTIFMRGITNKYMIKIHENGLLRLPLDELVEQLENIDKKEIISRINQNNISIEEYYSKIKKHCTSVGFSDDITKIVFLRGLRSENWKNSIFINIELPIDKLVEKLKNIEDIQETKKS